jgi:hypothetical protein
MALKGFAVAKEMLAGTSGMSKKVPRTTKKSEVPWL